VLSMTLEILLATVPLAVSVLAIIWNQQRTTDNLRREFTQANQNLRTEFTEANTLLRREFTEANQSLRAEFTEANQSLRAEFTEANHRMRAEFTEANRLLRKELTESVTEHGIEVRRNGQRIARVEGFLHASGIAPDTTNDEPTPS